MQSVRAYYDGKEFIVLESPAVRPNQKAIITILDEFVNEKTEKKDQQIYERFFGSLDDESYLEMVEALEECEKVYTDER